MLPLTRLLTLASLATIALAGHNCKCQDPSGVGPQWNDLTEQCCDAARNNCVNWPGFVPKYHGDQHHQVSPMYKVSWLSNGSNTDNVSSAPRLDVWIPELSTRAVFREGLLVHSVGINRLGGYPGQEGRMEAAGDSSSASLEFLQGTA